MRRLVSIAGLTLLAAVLFVPGCGGCGPQPTLPEAPAASPASPVVHETPPAPAVPPAEAPPEEAEVPPPAPGPVEARVRIVDLNGHPLADMAPIAATEPNAFREPVATGGLTGADGRSTILIPPGEDLHIRGWDPKLNLFANNFQTLAGQGNAIRGELELVMVPGSAIRATFADADGQPLSSREVRMMMNHPSRGPWWPSAATTDEHGGTVFNHIPAGRFVLDFETAGGLRRQVPETSLPVGIEVDLGLVVIE